MQSEGQQLKALRKSLGLTQEELGQRLGTTQASIFMIEGGSRRVGRDLIAAINREFGVNFLGEPELMHPQQLLIDSTAANLARLDEKNLRAIAKYIGELADD